MKKFRSTRLGLVSFRVSLSQVSLLLAGASFFAPAAVLAQGKPAEANVSMCIGCHEIPGYKASFPTVYSVPKLYGQSAKYIENALIAYRKGDRSHPTMRSIAGSLSDQDISSLAAYYGTK
jgi:cytochrome c553